MDMVTVPEQQKHLKEFMEGKTSIIVSLFEEPSEEGMYLNKVGVYITKSYAKNSLLYVSIKIMEKITHYCLIDCRSGPNVMSNIIMKELGLSCTNDNSKRMFSYNSQ